MYNLRVLSESGTTLFESRGLGRMSKFKTFRTDDGSGSGFWLYLFSCSKQRLVLLTLWYRHTFFVFPALHLWVLYFVFPSVICHCWRSEYRKFFNFRRFMLSICERHLFRLEISNRNGDTIVQQSSDCCFIICQHSYQIRTNVQRGLQSYASRMGGSRI